MKLSDLPNVTQIYKAGFELRSSWHQTQCSISSIAEVLLMA